MRRIIFHIFWPAALAFPGLHPASSAQLNSAKAFTEAAAHAGMKPYQGIQLPGQ